MNKSFVEYYRCPENAGVFKRSRVTHKEARPGFFRFGEAIAFGVSDTAGSPVADGSLPDLTEQVNIYGAACELPFDPDEIVDNLRLERYIKGPKKAAWKRAARSIYYALRPILPVAVRRHLQTAWLKGWDSNPFPRWPVDRSVDQVFERLMELALSASGQERIPFIWFWPLGKPGCAVMTHDVEEQAGLNYCSHLMDTDDSYNIKSSFQLIPGARYLVTYDTVAAITSRGFEANVHDWKHDGHLFDEYEKFRASALRINESGVRFGSKGFRSAILYRNQDWFGELNFSYDMSVPNVGHLDPQHGGCCTVMPYFVGEVLELPTTATQDYALFHVLKTYSMDVWHEQISLIMQQHGLINLIVHPDYLDTEKAKAAYEQLLSYLATLRDEKGLWIALPGEVDEWWRQRNKLQVVADGDGWRIDGPGAERATLAFAMMRNGKVTYEFA